ncbi:MAG: hypothetical protein R3Y65_08310 [Bacillota bacterium]
MKDFLSPADLWSQFEIPESTDYQTLQTDEFGEYVYEQISISGHKYGDGTCRIFGVYAYAKNAGKAMPCVLLVHDLGGRVDFSYIDYFLHLGFSVFMPDYSGYREGERHTIFPPSREHMNFASRTTSDINREIEKSVWIHDTLIFRYCLAFLRGREEINSSKIGAVSLGIGSIIGFHLAFCEPTLALSVAFHYGGWRDFENISKQLDFDKAKYLLLVAPQVYSQIAKVPLFLLGSTNTRIGDSDKIFDTFARCNGSVSNFLYLSPNYISTVDHLATRNLRLLLNQYLAGSHTEIPMPPHLEYSIEGGELFVTCEIPSEFSAKSVKLFFSQGENQSHLRAYKFVELVATPDGRFVGNLNVSSALSTTMIANVEYLNGFTLTSNQLKVPPFGDVLKKHGVITLGGRDSFFPLGTLTFPNANQFFRDKSQVVSMPIAHGIIGVSAPRIATFALADITLEKENKTILLQIYSDLPQKIRLLLSVSDNLEADFSTTIDLVGGEFWQKTLLDPSNFIDAELKPLASFENCTLAFFTSDYDFYISNMSLV